MKKFILLLTLSFAASVSFAQMTNPVTWIFTSKKVSEGVYDVVITASMQSGWHLYSQTQPADAIAQPTKFTFTANPLVQTEGKVKEAGKIEKFTDKELGVSANQYSKMVVFTQRVKLKGKAKSNVAGTVTYQTCDDKKCLPPKTAAFSVTLN